MTPGVETHSVGAAAVGSAVACCRFCCRLGSADHDREGREVRQIVRSIKGLCDILS